MQKLSYLTVLVVVLALITGCSQREDPTAPEGEQALLKSDDDDDDDDGLEFEADLSAANVVGFACPSPAEGEGEFSYNSVTKMLSYEIEFEDLLGADVAAHFHLPAPPGANAPPVITIAGAGPPPSGPLAPSSLGSPYVGTVGPLTAGQEAALLAGLVYVQIHTPACGPGELRGQVLPED